MSLATLPPAVEPEPDPADAHAARLHELAELVAAQARDDADEHAPRHRREVPVTDLAGRVSVGEGRRDHNAGRDRRAWHVLRVEVDHRCHPGAWREAQDAAMDEAARAAVQSGGENRAGRLGGPRKPISSGGMLALLAIGKPWGAAEAQYRPTVGQVCPGCSDLKMSPGWICSICHATRDDPRRFPMQGQARAKRKGAAGKVKRKAAKIAQ